MLRPQVSSKVGICNTETGPQSGPALSKLISRIHVDWVSVKALGLGVADGQESL